MISPHLVIRENAVARSATIGDSPALPGRGQGIQEFRVPRARHKEVCRSSPPSTRGSLYPARMHTLACNLVHCVFSTKDRANLIPDPDRLRQYLTGIARAKNIPLLAAGGTRNHLHVLLALPPAVPLAKAVQELKGNSSRWLNQNSNRFAWQRGYGAFSVSESRRQAVIAYIACQEEHQCCEIPGLNSIRDSSSHNVCRARGTQVFVTRPPRPEGRGYHLASRGARLPRLASKRRTRTRVAE